MDIELDGHPLISSALYLDIFDLLIATNLLGVLKPPNGKR